MKSIKRFIRNWLGINQDSSYPHRIVSMVYWRDGIIAVDGNGDMYEMNPSFGYGDFPTIQLLQKNPLGR